MADVGSLTTRRFQEIVAERMADLVDRVLSFEGSLGEARRDLRDELKQLIDVDRHKIPWGPLGGRLQGLLNSSQHQITLRRYAKLLTATPQLIEHLHAQIRDDADQMAKSGSPFERLLVAYNKAYFGNIAFKALPNASQMQIKGVVRSVSDGFVDRNGATLAFPGLSADIVVSTQPVRIHGGSADSRRVASDLTRIFMEALFDAAFQVPAVEGATALKLEGFEYPKFDADNPVISVDDFAKVATNGLRAEATVISHIGELVRGGAGLGINNETLASVIETAAGVIAKKLTEHELFCYYWVTSGKSRMQIPDARSRALQITNDVALQ